MRHHFLYCTVIITFLALSLVTHAQQISEHLIGNNYWYPGASTASLMAPGNAMDTAGFQLIRIGGFGANGYSNDKIVEYIQQIRGIGAEPIVQVNSSYSTQKAKDMITYINVTKRMDVTYWAIGNEPNHSHHQGGVQTNDQIKNYTKRIGSALKSVDHDIKIIAFDFAWYEDSRMTSLMGGSNDVTGKDANGRYYIDIISWHKYNFNSATGFETEINKAKIALNRVNQNRPESPIEWMIGELNTHYDNSLVTDPDQYVWSFHAGQLFAEIYALGMINEALAICPWSIYEGKNNDRGEEDRGYGDLSLFDKDFSGRSSYWHSLMLGQNMRKNYAISTDGSLSIKTIGMKDDKGVTVMVMNSNKTDQYSYSLQLKTGTIPNAQPLIINVDAGINKVYESIIPKESTQLLVFSNTGLLLKKYEYTAVNSADRVGPAIETFSCNAVTLPGKIEAENYCSQNGIIFQATTDNGGGKNAGYLDVGDYLEYVVTIPLTGTYKIEARVASLLTTGAFNLASSLTGSVDFPVAQTGGWQIYSTMTRHVALESGEQTLKINVTGPAFNLNWINIIYEPIAPALSFNKPADGDSFDQGHALIVGVNAQHASGINNVRLYVDNIFVRQENIPSYDWGFGNNDPVLKSLSAGTHELKAIAKANSGEEAEHTILIEIESITSRNYLPSEESPIYPNPTTGLIHIEANENLPWKITNRHGETVLIGNGTESNIGDLPQGIYFLKTNRGITKIIKN